MSYLIDPLEGRQIPVSLNADRAFTLQRVDPNGDPVDFDGSVTMWIEIDKANPTAVAATVDGANAAIVIPAATADKCKSGTLWQIVYDDNTKVPVLVGTFTRNDGR